MVAQFDGGSRAVCSVAAGCVFGNGGPQPSGELTSFYAFFESRSVKTMGVKLSPENHKEAENNLANRSR